MSDGPVRPKRRDPLWAKICLILGSVVAVVAGLLVVAPKVIASWATKDIPIEDLLPPGQAAENIDGAINLLLLGMDQRENSDRTILTDSIIVVHIPAAHDRVYMISIPRDWRVKIPAYPESGYGGGVGKINAAFAVANAKDGKGDPSTAGRRRGVNLMVQTLSDLTPGGLRFNGVAIINFEGFQNVIEAIGGVDLCVDERTTSIHRDRQGTYHEEIIKDLDNRYVYEQGCRQMEAWQALDYSRQRYNVTGGDYGRQKHQQQLIGSIVKKLRSNGTLTSPSKLLELQKAAGGLLTLDLGRTPVEDWVFTLRGLDADNIVMIRTNAGKPNSQTIDKQSFEIVTNDSIDLLKSVQADNVGEFLRKHPDWVAQDKA